MKAKLFATALLLALFPTAAPALISGSLKVRVRTGDQAPGLGVGNNIVQFVGAPTFRHGKVLTTPPMLALLIRSGSGPASARPMLRP
ncbi:MAG: hypothetical protein ACREJD_10305 [Phycisphaerales bacterium]